MNRYPATGCYQTRMIEFSPCHELYPCYRFITDESPRMIVALEITLGVRIAFADLGPVGVRTVRDLFVEVRDAKVDDRR